MKKSILILSVLSLFILTASDAEARRRHRHHKPAPKVVKVQSVFDSENRQKAVVLPGLVSVYQAYAASQYPWKPEEVWRIPKAEQELKTYHQPVNKGLSPMFMAVYGVIMGSVVGISGLAWVLSRP